MNNVIKSLIENNIEIAGLLENNDNITYKEMYKILNIIFPDKTAFLIELINSIENESFYVNKIKNINIILNDFNEYLNNDFVNTFKIINEQLNTYLDYYDFDYTDKFLFISDKQNYNYVISFIFKMMCSEELIKYESNSYLRYKHIVENQIYVTSNNIIDNFIYMCLVDINNEFKLNICNKDFLEDNFKINKFTSIFGAPKMFTDSKKRYETCAYHNYVLKAIKYSHVCMLLTPSKWFQSEISYLRNLRNELKLNNKLKFIKHFYETQPDGGISYFIYDNNYSGNCIVNDCSVNLNNYECILTEGKYYSLIDKFKAYQSINTRFVGNGWAKISTNDERLKSETSDNVFNVCVAGRNTKYIDKKHIKDNILHLNNWKVFTPETCTGPCEGFSNNFIIGKPYELCNQTYNVFIVNSEDEAKSLISYLKTNLVQKLTGIRKISHHINKDTIKYVPNVPLDRIWTDEKLNKYFNLSSNEVKIINN